MILKYMLKKISLIPIIIILMLLPIFSEAEERGTTGNIPPPSKIDIKIDNPFNCGKIGTANNSCTLMDLITTILNKIVMPIAAVAVVMWIIWAGFTYLMAQGKPAEIEKAHSRLLWSLVGAGILLGAAGISGVLQSTIEALIVP